MTDLDKLIEAVEAGEARWAYFRDAFESPSSRNAFDAYNGSLDAALRLHEALLPGHGWTLVDDGRSRIWRPGDHKSHPSILIDWQNAATPARAWLLAILRALKAKGDA